MERTLTPPSLHKTSKYNAELTNTVLLSSRLRHCGMIFRVSPVSEGLVPQILYRSFAPGQQWETSISRLRDESPSTILDPPL